MRWLVWSLILNASLCVAAPLCPEPDQREAKIGGNVITGSVWLHGRPLRGARVQLYDSAGIPVLLLAFTDNDGRFATGKLSPGIYRLEVDGWGSTSVELDPKLDKEFGFGSQVPFWWIGLYDNGCVSAGMSMDS